MISSFFKVMFGGIIGALCGVVGGLLIASMIHGILFLLFSSHILLTTNQPPVEAILFIGMGLGAAIGGIFGALISLKKA